MMTKLDTLINLYYELLTMQCLLFKYEPTRTQAYMKNCGQLKNLRTGKMIFPGVVQCQLVNLENKHTNNIIWTEQDIFWNMYAYTHNYMHIIKINIRRGHEFVKSGVWENLKG